MVYNVHTCRVELKNTQNRILFLLLFICTRKKKHETKRLGIEVALAESTFDRAHGRLILRLKHLKNYEEKELL